MKSLSSPYVSPRPEAPEAELLLLQYLAQEGFSIVWSEHSGEYLMGMDWTYLRSISKEFVGEISLDPELTEKFLFEVRLDLLK